MYDFEIDRILKIVNEKKYRVIGLQFPEGLKEHATGVADKIRGSAGCTVVISANPCYGACDLADREMLAFGCEALFHFGHAKMPLKTALPVHYLEVIMKIDPIPLFSKNLDKLEKNVGLITTVQHINSLSKVRDFLEGEGINVKMGKAEGRVKYAGQVLGCNFSSARSIAEEVDCFAYIGSGNFHPLGVALSTGKKTLAFDVTLNEVRDMSALKEKILRKRFAQITKASGAEKFGVIIGEKWGQMRKELALSIEEKLNKKGKKAYLLYIDKISPEVLLPFRKLDAFINTACPRVTIDDAERYKKPVLTPSELEIVLGERDWEDYVMDEIV